MSQAEAMPEGWCETLLADVASAIQYGYTASASMDASGPRFLRITDIQAGRVDWDTVPRCEIPGDQIERYRVAPNDIVFARTGATTGKSFLVGECPDAVFASYLIRVRLRPGLRPDFLYWFFQSADYWQQITDSLSGTAQPNCNGSKLAQLRIPLPPRAEQDRIVAALAALMERVELSRKRLTRVPEILKRFRQAVLAAACSGELTVDWRETNPSGHRSSEIRTGYETPGDPDDLQGAAALPNGWAYTPLQSLCRPGRPVLYGIIKPGPHDPEGVPYVRVCEMKDGSIDVAGLRRASKERAKQFERATLSSGDLLISKDGTIGRVAIVPPELEGGNITQHLVRASLQPDVHSRYVALAIQSPFCQEWLVGEKKGIALQGVNVEDFRKLPIPMPPRPEQDEIVRRVQALFALADKVEERVAAATARAEGLTQAILAKAFRGELVPTEAELARQEGRDYEPAEVLLERIREERGVANGRKASAGRSKSRNA
jgi:type I restriction enzyme, S subunit